VSIRVVWDPEDEAAIDAARVVMSALSDDVGEDVEAAADYLARYLLERAQERMLVTAAPLPSLRGTGGA
jgi:hypothetical protein